ncbi:MAG: hypothetical protein JEY99_06175 [Spirochaetales bacterium]|nr:hypothetical protein [Spirochaetales bacterium]
MKRYSISLICFFLLCTSLIGQENRLSDGDVEKFLNTFPVIMEELDALGQTLESTGENFILPAAVRTSEEAQQIFSRQGWDDNYYDKIGLILEGYTLSIMESEMLTVMPDIQDALDEIDATPVSPYFTAEMKKQTRDMIVSAVRGMDQALFDEMDSIAPADMEQIRVHKDEIKEMLDGF